MARIIFITLLLSILAGQLIKIPVGASIGGATFLDITVLILCFWGILRLKFRLNKPPTFILAALIFIAIGIISLIFTPLRLNQLQFLSSFFYIIRFSAYILLGWLIYQKAFTNLNQRLPFLLLASGVGLAILGLLQFIFLPDLKFLMAQGWDPHYFRTASTFLDPNFLGSFMVLTLLILFQYLGQNRWNIIFFALVYLTLLTTFSRGAYLAFLVSFTVFSFLNRSLKLAILTIALFSSLLLGFYLYQLAIAQPRGIDRAKSAQFRHNTWQQGLQIFQKSPLFGVGFNTYRFALEQYNLADEEFLQSHGSSTNDSSLLYVAATTGVLGLTSYLFFLLTLIKIGIKGKILTAAILGLITQSFFANTLFYPFLLAWIIILTGAQRR